MDRLAKSQLENGGGEGGHRSWTRRRRSRNRRLSVSSLLLPSCLILLLRMLPEGETHFFTIGTICSVGVLQIFKYSFFLDRKSRWQFPSREDRNGNPWPLQQIRPRSFEHARRDRKSDSFFLQAPTPHFPIFSHFESVLVPRNWNRGKTE